MAFFVSMFSTVGNHTLTATITDLEGKSKSVILNSINGQLPTLTVSDTHAPGGSGEDFISPTVTITIDKQNYPAGAVFQKHFVTEQFAPGDAGNGWKKVYTAQPNIHTSPFGEGYYVNEIVVTDMWGQKQTVRNVAGGW